MPPAVATGSGRAIFKQRQICFLTLKMESAGARRQNPKSEIEESSIVTGKGVYIGVVGVVNYFIEHKGGFFAVDRATGKIAWRFPMSVIPGSFAYGVASSPAVAHGLVFFGGLDGTFYAFKEMSAGQ